MSLDKFFKENNIDGDYAKILKGEDVELPDGVESLEAYEDVLKAEHRKKQDEVAIARNQEVIDKAVEAKRNQIYPATINPLKNLAKAKYDCTDEELKDLKVKEIAELMTSKVKAAYEKKVGDRTEREQELVDNNEKLQNELVLKSNAINDWELKYKVDIEKAKEEGKIESLKYIKDTKMTTFVSGILEELSSGTVEVALDSIHGALRRHGYKVDLEYNESSQSHMLIPKHKDGTKAMDKGKNKHVSLKELVIELAALDKFLKVANVGEPDPVLNGISVITNTKGEEIKTYSPSWATKG